jgi:monovalent cation:H+ antiporter-2, CPA2 family
MHGELTILFLLLTASVAGVAIARRFHLPTMLAYLGIGIAIGPHGLGLLQETEQVKTLAEFGIVFLMFSIGLEFSLQHLNAMRVLVFGFGATQMILTALGTGLITWFGYEQGWKAGIAVGLAVAMSSTAIVARMLSERFELHSRSGRQTMGVLLFQDIAVVPCLILLPALAEPRDNLATSLGVAALEAAVMLTIMIWLGQRLIRRMYDRVAVHRSEELFILATLWLVVGLSLATGYAGMSLALGAFVGGMLISETPYRHQVEADIRPFRDILLGFFFITVGMMLDLRFVLEHLHKLMLALVLLIGGKATVVMLITYLARNPLDTALRTSAQLAQAGEFGLVLISMAYQLKLVQQDVFQVTLSAMLLSMFAAPFLIERAARLSGELGKGDWAHKAKTIHDISAKSFGLEDHVIICGYGRTGQQIGEFLAIEGIPFLALDIDPQCIAHATAKGGSVVFGSADRSEVLQAAGLSRARGVAIAYPDRHSAERTLQAVRRKRQDVVVVVRAADEADVALLKQAGATEVIPELVEGSLMIAAETLSQIGVPMERAIAHVRDARAERYDSLRSFYSSEAGASPARKPETLP